MKIFVYKTLFVFFLIFVLFQVTVGMKLRQIEKQIDYFQSKENIEVIKDKIRNELKSAVEKENYLNESDAELINNFIEKIKTELNNN